MELNPDLYQVTINNQVFSFNQHQILAENIINLPHGELHLIDNNKSYLLQIIEINRKKKKVLVNLNGAQHEIIIEEPIDLLLNKMGYSHDTSSVLKEIKAPMPGLVLEINVKEGEEVEKDHKILVLEAMKMENVITIPGKSKVDKIHVKQGDAVEKNQLLISLSND